MTTRRTLPNSQVLTASQKPPRRHADELWKVVPGRDEFVLVPFSPTTGPRNPLKARVVNILALTMSPTTCAAALIALSTVASLSAQTPPNFAGRWTTDAVAAADSPAGRGSGGRRGRPDMGSGWGSTITITQDPRQLTVEYAFFSRGDLQPPLKFAFALDGSETRNTVRMGRGPQLERSKAAWDGQTLVITTTHEFKDPRTGKAGTMDVVRRLSLESADSLVVETVRDGVLAGPPDTTRTVYRRLPADR
jgi:hypothetical protein